MPWLTLGLVAVFVVSPLGQGAFRDAFVSGVSFSNEIAQLGLLIVLGTALAMMVAEWAIRIWLRQRRMRSENRG